MPEVPAQPRDSILRSASARARATIDEPMPAGSVVLARTRRGAEEVVQKRFGLGSHQRRLLELLDGVRSLDDIAGAEPRLQPSRLARDAARLVAFGLVRQVRGELPRDLLIATMNLTARIPLDQLRPLEPERTVSPMQPRVAPSTPTREQSAADEQPPVARRKPLVLLLVAVAIVIVAIAYLT